MTKHAKQPFLGLLKIALVGVSFPLLLTSHDWVRVNTKEVVSSLAQLNIKPRFHSSPYPSPFRRGNIWTPPFQGGTWGVGRGFDSPFPRREGGWGVRSILYFVTPTYLYTQTSAPPIPQSNKPADVEKISQPNQEKKQEKEDKSDDAKKQVIQITVTASALGGVLVLYLGVLWFFPLLLLRLPAELKIPKIVLIKEEIKLPVGFVIRLKYHPRVLDAWVKKHIDTFKQKFIENETVEDRKDYVSLPMLLNKQEIEELTAETLRKSFEKEKRVRLLIWGDGGSGKTTIACQIAKWAMEKDKSKRLTKHLMLPVLIEEELDLQTGEGIKPLMEAIAVVIQELIDSEQKIVDELLVEQLLRKRRILLIVDHFSEMSKETRDKINPDIKDFPANALVVTSRIEETFRGIDAKIETLRFDGGKLAYFIEQYLKQCKKWHLFEDEQEEFLRECAQLARIVGDKKTITVLLAKLYAERMINAKENLSASEISLDNIPDLIIDHLEKLNYQGERETKKQYPNIKDDAKLIAWKCLEQKYKPSYVESASVIKHLGEDADNSLEYFEKSLRLLRQGHKKTIGFALDPLAEYLAGLYLVENFCKDNEESWREFLVKAESKTGEEIKGFLLAVRECCLAKSSAANVPGFVVEELGKLAGIDPEAEKQEQLKRRIRRLINDLFVPEEEDRLRAIDELAKMGTLAKSAAPALLKFLKDEDSDVRYRAAWALGDLGNASEPVLQGLLALLDDTDYGVRYRAAWALGELGNASEPVLQGLLALMDDTDDVRSFAAWALGDLGNASEPVVQGLLARLEDTDSDVRRSAAEALGKLGNASEPVVQGLLALLKDTDYGVRGSAAGALGKLGNASEPVVQGLLALLKDTNYGVRYSAAEALEKLRNPSEES